jgi:predicted ATPase
VRRDKIRGVLTALDPALSDTLAYLLGLLGIQKSPDPLAQMDAQVRRRRTLEAIKQIILRESLEHARVVSFEDLHWIDSETPALHDLLADSAAGATVERADRPEAEIGVARGMFNRKAPPSWVVS